MKIIIVGYYHYADGIRAAGESLEAEGLTVIHFPLMEKINEQWTDELTSLIKDHDIILWWYPIHQIPYNGIYHVLFYSKKQYECIKHFYFNWDPSYIPIETKHSKDIIKKKEKIYPLLDLIISVNPLEVSAFSNIVYCPPGFSSSYHYPEENSEYSCEVSFVGTNLYEDEKVWPKRFQRYNRGALLDLIYHSDIDFKVYGPPWLKERYPKAYVSELTYDQTHLVFSNSLINISINCVSIDGYFSERVPQIMASRGVVYTDNHLGCGFIEGVDYILIDQSDPIKQIKALISNKLKLEIIQKSAFIKRRRISWDKFKDIVVKHGSRPGSL
jgi:hypothetical protein